MSDFALAGTPNVPDWEPIAEASAAGDAELSITVDSPYRVVYAVATDLSCSESTDQYLNMTLNGVTSGYYYYDHGGASTSADSSVPVSYSNGSTFPVPRIEMRFSGTWSSLCNFSVDGGGTVNQPFADWGNCAQATSPLDTVSLEWPTGTIIGDIEAYGLP